MVQGRTADYFLPRPIDEIWTYTFEFFQNRRYFTIENPQGTGDGNRYVELVRKPTFSSYGYRIYMNFSPTSEGTAVHAEVKLNYGWGSYAHLKPSNDLKAWAIYMGTEPVNIAKGAYACCIIPIVVMVLIMILPYMMIVR